MGEANRRGTRDQRITQSQAVAAMRRDDAAALATVTAEANARHAAQLRIKQLDREERARQIRSDPRTAAARMKGAAAMMILAATASSLPPKARFDKGYVDKIG